ncbi:MAG: hypothetical protein FJ271_12215 [Planctomycetes bacterium]|nr:hypothetical protein [Planctomycetota bacterium]
MRACIVEDRGVALLEPLTLTRAAFDLWCGASSLLDRQRRTLPVDELGVLVRPELAGLCRRDHPGLVVNDLGWLNRGPVILVNARWLPGATSVADWQTPRVGLVDDELAYVILPRPALAAEVLDQLADLPLADLAESWTETLPSSQAGGAMIRYPWDLVERNGAELSRDAELFQGWQRDWSKTASLAVLGPAEQFLAHPETTIEPFVTVDTRPGPVIIDRGAVIQSFSSLAGPCYIGPDSWIVGAKLRGGTIGPGCRIGGEVEASIVQGFSNKYHDGFLGHSYVGAWVNLGAGTQTSDLRNDYGQIRVVIGNERLATGLTKVGVFLGDHTKIGLGTLLNSGTVVGAFCNLLPSGGLLPLVVPSFCLVKNGQLSERQDLRQAFATAATVLRRRGQELNDTHIELFLTLYDQTAASRQRLIRESDTRRWRKSV